MCQKNQGQSGGGMKNDSHVTEQLDRWPNHLEMGGNGSVADAVM